jgi:parallel beta-helix repeat protein
MRKRWVGLAVLAALAAAIAPQVALGGSTTWVVDKDKFQCPNAQFTSIQAAVTAAAPGDTIKVCPDQYNESVTVGKPGLSLIGPTRPRLSDCSIETAPDPTKDAIVTGGAFSFSLANREIKLTGFAVQGAADGIDTSPAYSGYEISDNLVQHNSVRGINFVSSGLELSKVESNCLRLNGNGLQSEGGGDLRYALVDKNSTYRNATAGLDFSGAGARAYLTVSTNISVEDGFIGISLDNSIGTTIKNNTTQGTPMGFASGSAIYIGGANNGLDIVGNKVNDGIGNGIRFDQSTFVPVFTAANVGLNVASNKVYRTGASGILAIAGAPNLTLSTLSANTSSLTGITGIRLQAGNNNNRVTGNIASKNGVNGIHAEGATGNTFERNQMFLNVQFDARDDNRPSNTWTSNKCDLDFPPGTICS